MTATPLTAPVLPPDFTVRLRANTAAITKSLPMASAHVAVLAAQMLDIATPREFVTRVEARAAGVEARYRVRAGFAPAYADADAVCALAVRVLTGAEPDIAGLPRTARTRIAAAVLESWATHHTHPAVPVLAWHRLIGTTRIEVTR